MKSRLSFVVLLIFLIGLTPYVTVSAQTYTVSPTGWTGKPSTNVTYNGNTWMAGTTDGVYVKAKAVVSGTSLTFNVQKSSGTFNSQTSVTIRKDMKISGSSVTDAGTIIKMSSMSAGNSGMTIDIEPDFSSGSHTYHFILTSGSTVFYTNPITVSAESSSLCPDNNHPHMIDLGLPSGTKWACCNVGAQSPEETGCYYAWGETTGSCEGKTIFDWEYYKYNHYDINDENSKYGNCLTKYCQDSEYGYNGFTDELTTLESTDDAATVNWGDQWRMPNRTEMNELINKNNTSWTVTTLNGVAGLLVTSLVEGYTDKSIFLPFTGWFDWKTVDDFGVYAEYWTSSVYRNPYNQAYRMYIDNSGKKGSGTRERDTGLTIRPIYIGSVALDPLSLSLNSIVVTKGESTSVQITSGNGSYTVATNNSDVANAVIDGSSVTVTAITAGTATITVTDTQSGETATIEVTVNAAQTGYLTCPDNNHPHMIDLGLPSGTKWACCNVDTDHPENQSPTNYGGYYGWGEIETKTTYDWSNYIHCDGSSSTCHDLGNDISGTVYDVAHMRWGGTWRMPSEEMIVELYNNCTHSWTNVNGTDGCVFNGSNGGTIFLPAAGYRKGSNTNLTGRYTINWSSIPSASEGSAVTFDVGETSISKGGMYRYYGHSVRPVAAVGTLPPLWLSENNTKLVLGDEANVEITSGGGNYTVVSSDESVATSTINGSSILISSTGVGFASITVTDTQSGEKATIEVTVESLVLLQLAVGNYDMTEGTESSIAISSGNGSYTVATNNSDVATAVIDGSSVIVTAIATGTASITVTDTRTGETADIAVTVHTPLAISENSLSMMVGDADVVVSMTGGSGTYNVVSSNQNVVRATFQALESGGNITVHAVGKGTATLTVKDTKTGSQVTIEVTAKDHLQLAKSSVDITVGGNTTVNISKGNDSYAVSSSNQNVATATIDGSSVNITTNNKGTAIITVTDTETGETATIDVTVYTPLVLSKSTWSMIADHDDDEVVRLTGGSGTYTVTSSNQNVVTATIEALDNGGTITVHAVGVGTATITLKDTKTGDQMTMEVTVFAPLILAKNALHLYPNYNKESVYITSGNGGYTAVSSNSSVATAAIDGSSVKITALKKGTATITVTDTQTALTATVEVTVIDHSNDPLTPTSPFPSDGAVDVGTSGTFVWLIPSFNGGKGTPYELYLDTDESFSNTNGRPYRTGTGNSCAFTGLKPGTKYYWKVKMDNGRGQSVISEVWNFTTKNQNMYVPIMRGDVNGDKNVTISDVMMIVNHVVTNTTGSNFIAAHADVNGDGNINITDAMMLVRIILNEDTTEPCLEVWHKDGSKIMFSLDEYPKVTYLGDMVTIEAATTVEYEFQAIRKMTFNQSAKTISTTVTPFTRNGETVTFLPADADLSVRVTLPNGRTLREFVVRKGERATLPLDARIADVYRINVNGVTYKIKTR